MVAQADSTLFGIEQEVRNYVGITSESVLPTATIDQEINYFYSANIPESIKMDQLRTVYTFYTIPYCDRYPVDTNTYQSFRDPVYIDGLRAVYYKDRGLFYAYWPNVRTYLNPALGDGTSTLFTFSVAATPIVRNTFMCSSVDVNGAPLICADSAQGQTVQGNLLQIFTDSVGDQIPTFPPTSPLPPNPLPDPPYSNQVGIVNYQTGAVTIQWPTPPAAGQQIKVNFFAPSFGRPIAVLYWNNEIIVRPVPKFSHRIELEAYQTPLTYLSGTVPSASFTVNTQKPFLNNFKRYISLGCSINLLGRMGDTARKAELEPDFFSAEGRILERQANEEIGQSNVTIFNAQGPYFPQYPYGGYWY